jgi:hypothetical protein
MQKLLIKHSRNMYRDFCVVLYLTQIIISIVTLGCKINIDLEFCKTFFQELF